MNAGWLCVILAVGCGGSDSGKLGPGAVMDLSIQANSVGATRVALTFTAPANAGSAAALYDLRYSLTKTITSDEDFSVALAAQGENTPQLPGQMEFIAVTQLTRDTKHWFCLRSYDSSLHPSPLSNVVEVTTTD